MEGGVALSKVDRYKNFHGEIGGKFGESKFSAPKLAENAFSTPFRIPSLQYSRTIYIIQI